MVTSYSSEIHAQSGDLFKVSVPCDDNEARPATRRALTEHGLFASEGGYAEHHLLVGSTGMPWGSMGGISPFPWLPWRLRSHFRA